MMRAAIVIVVVAFAAVIGLHKVDWGRYRMDSDARALQNELIAPQLTAIRKHVPVIVTFLTDSAALAVTEDVNGNGRADANEPTRRWPLAAGVNFMIPPRSLGGAPPSYVTGPGLSYLGQAYEYPTLTFYPSGSTSGSVVVYIGRRGGGLTDLRALQVDGATAKVRFFRLTPDTAWRPAEM